jgi:hypothetical protein
VAVSPKIKLIKHYANKLRLGAKMKSEEELFIDDFMIKMQDYSMKLFVQDTLNKMHSVNPNA